MSYADLRALSERRLDAFINIGLGGELWPKQTEICESVSRPRSVTVVPSCNASGKTWLAARIALAFYWTFPDSVVVTTSSTEDQLKDALWTEIRSAHAAARVPIPGRLAPSDMWIRDGEHLLKGTVARTREGFQGLHRPHKLIVADEASAVDEEAASGINALLSTGDARLLLILNPTDDQSWASEQAASNRANVIRIRAWDTPNLARLSNEEIRDRWGVTLESDRVPISIPVPEGANLTSPEWLDDMLSGSMGPGTPEWENRVEAMFWSASDTQLIIQAEVDLAHTTTPTRGRRVLGVDLAPYGDAENVTTFRIGNTAVRQDVQPSMRTDLYWQHIRTYVNKFQPDILIWDADGVGGGSWTDAELAVAGTKTVLMPFRGGTKLGGTHLNTRSLWWWRLRQQFQHQNIHLAFKDPKLEKQLTTMRYEFTENGLIKVLSKKRMKTLGFESPDRADSLMYAFAIDPPQPKRPRPHPSSEKAMWMKDLARLERRRQNAGRMLDLEWNPVIDAPVW